MVFDSVGEVMVEIECVHARQLILVGSSPRILPMTCLIRGVDGHGSYDLPLSLVPFLGNQPYFKGQPTGFETCVWKCHLLTNSLHKKYRKENKRDSK